MTLPWQPPSDLRKPLTTQLTGDHFACLDQRVRDFRRGLAACLGHIRFAAAPATDEYLCTDALAVFDRQHRRRIQDGKIVGDERQTPVAIEELVAEGYGVH